MKSLTDLLKSRPDRQIYNPPTDLPLDETNGNAPPYVFPPELIRELAGKSEAQISSILSRFRTGLSGHRTDLSEYRTNLSDARTHMANERTHLSQIRTALALMSFGITLNRFSIYLMESQRMPELSSTAMLRDTEYVGIGMVVLGIAMLAWSLIRYHCVHKEIEALNFAPPRLSLTLVTLAIILLGAGSAVWMITGGSR